VLVGQANHGLGEPGKGHAGLAGRG
jgi:hypothetical protein